VEHHLVIASRLKTNVMAKATPMMNSMPIAAGSEVFDAGVKRGSELHFWTTEAWFGDHASLL